MRVEVLDTETTRNDEMVKALIGTIWSVVLQEQDGCVVIDGCGGIRLQEDEYKVV